MTAFEQQRIALATGVTLNVATAGPKDGEPIIFLHGFPESHRTWRNQIEALSGRYYCIAPDQRGFAKSDKPEGVENYAPDRIIGDLAALADALGIGSFSLAGHDWGGAIAWGGALTLSGRVDRLIIANAPHPFIFQRTLVESRDQRVASQYMRAFRDPSHDPFIHEHGLAAFLAKTLDWNRSPGMSDAERNIYFEDWAREGAPIAMLNWYRAAQIVVPEPDEEIERPTFLDAPFPPLTMPVLIVWGTGDTALLPCQLEGLGEVVEDLTLVEVDAGHFVPWEAPGPVNAAIEDFLAAKPIG
ncbi:alpha/beta fold hydrolase [Parasphingopyxis marina]|uniref:Alpha/beta hydrolase n=1 Tax=Parasphingopyxis marina TaxID=2761622 RepID=A0A842I2N6_9SPHN|nr:alpha/beta hydrolase [Parasphingopyxis marina]MBC2779009.1 alpha/beta hydrolase [Parasphingopyxis marina]